MSVETSFQTRNLDIQFSDIEVIIRLVEGDQMPSPNRPSTKKSSLIGMTMIDVATLRVVLEIDVNSLGNLSKTLEIPQKLFKNRSNFLRSFIKPRWKQKKLKINETLLNLPRTLARLLQ